MFNLFNRLNNEKGFTLVELMVVVVIIGILVAIIIPIYGSVQDNSAMKAHESNLRAIDGAIGMYNAEKGKDPDSIQDLIDRDLLSEEPELPKRVADNPDKFLMPGHGIDVENEDTHVYILGKETEDGPVKAFPAPNDEKYPESYRHGETFITPAPAGD